MNICLVKVDKNDKVLTSSLSLYLEFVNYKVIVSLCSLIIDFMIFIALKVSIEKKYMYKKTCINDHFINDMLCNKNKLKVPNVK